MSELRSVYFLQTKNTAGSSEEIDLGATREEEDRVRVGGVTN